LTVRDHFSTQISFSLTRGTRLLIGVALLIIGILQVPFKPGGFYYVLFLPVWTLFSPYSLFTVSFLLIFSGSIIILYTLLEGDRKHGWVDLTPNCFLLFVIWMDSFIMYDDTTHWSYTTHYAQGLILLDGFLVLILAFIIPRLRGGALSRQVIYWVYLVYGTLIMLNSFYPIKV
jgi:hypothetical protein